MIKAQYPKASRRIPTVLVHTLKQRVPDTGDLNAMLTSSLEGIPLLLMADDVMTMGLLAS